MNQTDKIRLNKRYLIQIDNDWLSVLIRSWIACNKPCSLSLISPKTPGYSGVEIFVSNEECITFINRVKEFTNDLKIYEYV